MSRVDLGFAEPCEPWQVSSGQFPSKIGGKPAWLSLANLPSSAHLQCTSCQKPMIFLCQIYASFEDDPDNFHRTLFVFICRDAACCQRNTSTNIKVFRNSLKRQNPFYPYEPPVDEQDGVLSLDRFVNLCNLCGSLGEKQCSKCRAVHYCSRDHQIRDWKEGHKADCGDQTRSKSQRKSPLLFNEFEIVIEPEELDIAVFNEQIEYEKFAQLQAEGKTGTMSDVSESELEMHASAVADNDKDFLRFRKRVEQEPEQVLRYDRGGAPLWIAAGPTPMDTVPNCDYCGASRQFEVQIMPQLLSIVGETALDWGVIAIYTCSRSCVAGDSYKNEFVFKQDVAINDL